MNRDKIRNFWEIVYNCPLILLVLFTSLIVIPVSGKIPVCNVGKEVVAAHFDGGEGEKNPDAADGSVKSDTDDGMVEKTENEARQSLEKQENAGECRGETDDIKSVHDRADDSKNIQTAENSGKEKHGTTEFVEYTPVKTESRYYSDAGKVALTTEYDYAIENESYFNDAAFLGDSRTLGISDYAGLEGADFFCDNGMTIYKLLGDDGVTYQKTGEKVDMKQVLQEKHYGKIYIMLGMNELGYGNTPMYLKQYLEVIRQIKEWQPGVIIYIMANLHVSREKNNMESEFNNININDKNVASARIANGRDVFYLDCNPLFTDEEGYLQEELTFDGVHLYAQHYDKWRDFLFAHGVEGEEGETMTAAVQEGGEGYGENAAQ